MLNRTSPVIMPKNREYSLTYKRFKV